MTERNVLGGDLEPCGTDPVTGFHRDGTCTVGPHDVGLHAVCAVMTDGSLCAMGGLTPMPVRSALRHFPQDFTGPTGEIDASAS